MKNFEERTIYFPGMVARVYIPHLTDEERETRLRGIHKEAENLLRAVTS